MVIPHFLKELAAGLFESLTSKSTSRKSSKLRDEYGGQGRRADKRREDSVGESAVRDARAETNRQGQKHGRDSTTGCAPTNLRYAGRGRHAEVARHSGETLVVHSLPEPSRVGEAPKVYSVPDLGLPEFDYSPWEDDFPDPGEVVWAWVPYEEDRGQGKDCPVLALVEIGRCAVFAQLTSKDHGRDVEQKARNRRF